MGELTKGQAKFYRSSYARLLLAVQQSYDELINVADIEGILFLNDHLGKFGKEAVKRCRKEIIDIF